MRRLISDNDMDRVLSREDEILPSSGFAVSVMDTVWREAAAPPPIPFPWKRALPGLVAGGVALALVLVVVVAAVVQLVKAPTVPQFSMSSLPLWTHGPHQGMTYAAIWTVLALLLTCVSVKLSMRLASSGA